MELNFLIAFVVLAGLVFLFMIGIIVFAGVIEGRLPPEKQGRPYPEGRPKDYRNH